MNVRLEFQPRDLWVGAYFVRRPDDGRLHVWICLIPTLPIHLELGDDRRQLRRAPTRSPALRLPERVRDRRGKVIPLFRKEYR